MRIIKIIPSAVGSHDSVTGVFSTVPEGWAVIPESMECANFPFGEVTTEEIDGVMTVTHWTPNEMPEPEPEPEPGEGEPTLDERVTTLEESSAEMTEALEMILTGVTE